jgi:hypothetical protein
MTEVEMSVLARRVVVREGNLAPAENQVQAVLHAPVENLALAGNQVQEGNPAQVVPRVPVKILALMGIPACPVRRDYAGLHNAPYYPAIHTLHNLRIPACFVYGFLHILRVISDTNVNHLDYPAAY